MLKRILFAVLCTTAFGARAQEGVAISAPYGIYVYCGKALPKKAGYIIQRTESGKNNWQTIGTTHFPADSAMLFSSYAEAAALNAGSPVIDESEKSEIWKRVRKHNILDSLGYYAAFPAFKQAIGIVYYDTAVVSGKIYDYKVRLADPATKSGEVLISKVVYNPQVIKTDLRTVYAEPYENKVMLRYYTAGGFEVANVKLYRQYYMQGQFKEVPAMFNTVSQEQKKFYLLTDVNVKAGLVYNYFAVPYDQFGNPGLPSDTVRLTNFVQAHIPAVERIKAVSDEKNHAIKLNWKFASAVHFLKSINIYRSESYDTARYDLIGTASAKDSVFTDRNVMPVKTYYYFIKLNGDRTSGNASSRVQGMLKADRQSAPPSGLQGSAAANGVALSWGRPAADTRGYYLYRSENDTLNMKQVSGFIPVSGKNKETYTDTVLLKGKHSFYYIVRAENTSYSKSRRSEFVNVTVSLSKQDRTPVKVKARNAGKAVMLYWSLVANQRDDIKGYNLYRKEAADTSGSAFTKLNSNTLRSTQNYWEDSTAVTGQEYIYRLEILKQAGNTSAEVNYHSDRPKLLSPGGLIASRNAQNITIAWDASMQVGVTGYKIYKLDPEGNPALLSEVKGKEKSVYTGPADMNKKMSYTVVSVNKSNEESKPDTWVSIR